MPGRSTQSLGIILNILDTNREFEALARQFLAGHPEIRHEWRPVKSVVSGGRTDLICEPGSAREVFASLTADQITVGSGAVAIDFEAFGRRISNEQLASEAFSHFLSLLEERGITAVGKHNA